MPGNNSVILTAKTDPLSWKVEDLDIPEAVYGSAVIKVLYAPLLHYHKEILCGTRRYPYPEPFIPGGNCVGRIHSLGSDAAKLKIGDLVLVDPTIAARDDPSSQILLGMHATSAPLANAWRSGAFAQYAQVPLENVFLLDESRLIRELGYELADLSLIQTCMIPFGGLADAGVRAGDTVVIAPATGRFSGAAVITALAIGANVVAVGRRQNALDVLLTQLGKPKSLKTAVVVGDVEKDTAALSHAVGARGADVVLDLSPPAAGANGKTPSHLLAGLNVLRRGGVLSLMGGIGGTIAIPHSPIVFKNLVIRGRFMYERDHIEQVIKLVESGKLPLGKAVGMKTVAEYGLAEFERAVNEAAKLPGWGECVQIVP